MGGLLTQAEASPPHEIHAEVSGSAWAGKLRSRPTETLALTLALCAVPISIAVSEFFLVIALVCRLIRCARGEAKVRLPRAFWFWLAWAGLETVSWAVSPQAAKGWGEIRRLLLIASLFFVIPALQHATDRLQAWRGIFLASAIGSLFLIGDFCARFISYRREIRAADDISIYLRTGGLLHHWMVFGTVELLVVAGLVAFWFQYPEERRRWWPVVALNAVAIVLSLTRTIWVVSLLLLGIELTRRRSKWLWALPVLPVAIYFLAPAAIRSRAQESIRPNYFSNAERIEMLRVGWRMIKEHPLVGVGAGRVERLYRSYLLAGEPLPKYHGHLHNNLLQLAAEFGLPVAAAAMLFVWMLFRELLQALRRANDREAEFSCRSALLGLTGFLVAGFFDYTYGHSLGLILLSFTVLSPLAAGSVTAPASREWNAQEAGSRSPVEPSLS